MLKNKIIIKKIRNIFILLMAIIIMVGVYTNIRNSRAENVIQIEVEISDKSNKIDTQKITIDATETKDGNYLIKLPTSVNEFVVSKYYTTDGAEVNMINVDNSATDNTDCTLRLTETEIANKKLQLQTDYDTKEFTTDDQQTVTLYNKELKNSGISDEAENDNSKTSKTSENVQEQEENQDNVIVKGYMLPDTKAEITEVDTNTLTNVKLPDENKSLKKAYEVSTYRMVENTSAVQNETAEQSNNTEEQETVEEQASVQAENIETQQESEQAVTTEKVEYNPTEYGENLTVKIKNTEENTVATAYSLTEDGKIVDSTNVDTNTDASESAEQTSQASSATNGEYAETSVDKKETTVKVVLVAEEVITADENKGIDEITDINEVKQNEEDVNYDDQIVTTAAIGESMLRSTAGETGKTSAFFGEALVKRENVDNVTFENSAKFGGTRNYYDAKQNTLDGHKNPSTTWYDLARHNDATIHGSVWGSDYLKLNGTSDYVDLGKIEFGNSAKLDATIAINAIQSGEREIVSNFQDGGAGIWLSDGKPAFSVYSETQGKYIEIFASEQLKVGVKTRIVGDYDGSNMYLYVDGKLVAQTALTGKVGKPQHDVGGRIGCNPAGDGGADGGLYTSMNVYNVKINEGYVKTKGAYDATNNTGSGHNSSTKTWVDATGLRNGTVSGGTWGSDYLRLNGTSDYVNLGSMTFDNNSLTMDAVISLNAIQSGERIIVSNFEQGGAGLWLNDGVPVFMVYIQGVGFARVTAPNKLTVGTKVHLTGTYDGIDLDLYVNGTWVGKTACKGTIGNPQNNEPMLIGSNPSGNVAWSSFTNMNVYSIRIYDEVVWDFSANNDNSILGWYDVLSANRGGIRVYIGSNNKIYANTNASYMFAYVGYNADSLTTESVTNIELLNTTKTTNMTAMFQFFRI